MMKEGILSSWRNTLDHVRRGVASLVDERQALQRKRDSLHERLRECINRPLSKVAMMELCGRMVDMKATAYREKFSTRTAQECMRVEGYTTPGKRPLVLADVDALMGRDFVWPMVDGGALVEPHAQWINAWWRDASVDACYFFGDVIKAKLPELWADVKLPHKDDGKSLERREEEAAKLREEISKVDARLAALDAELGDLREAAKIAPPPNVPEEESTADFIWCGASGLQRNPRKAKAASQNMEAQRDES